MPTFPGDFRSKSSPGVTNCRPSDHGYRSVRFHPGGWDEMPTKRVASAEGKDPEVDTATYWVLPTNRVTFSAVVE